MPAALANLLGKVDANGALVVSLSGGSATATNLITNQLTLDVANQDVVLVRDLANVLALKNGTNSQIFRVYGTTTGPKYLNIGHTGANGQIQTNDASALQLGVNSTIYWQIVNGGNLQATTDITYDIGQVATTRPRNVYAQNFIGGGASLTGITGATGGISNIVNTNIVADSDNNGSGVIDFTTGIVSKWQVVNAGHLTAMGAFQLQAADGTVGAPSQSFVNATNTGWYLTGAGASAVINTTINGTARTAYDTGSQYLASGIALSWSSGGIGAATDVTIRREAAGHLIDRDGVNAQKFSVANTWTSTISNELFQVDWQTTLACIVGTRTAATGTARPLRLVAQDANGSAEYSMLQLSKTAAMPFARLGMFQAGMSLGTTALAGNMITLAEGTNTATSGAIGSVAILPTYNQASGTAANTDLLINRTQTLVGSGAQLLIDAQVSGVSKFNVDNQGSVLATSLVSTGSVSAGGTSAFRFTGRTALASPADGQFNLTNSAISAGVGLDVGTDGVLGVRVRAQNAFAQLVAASVRGAASAFASLPTAVEGMLVAVTDSNTNTWGATIAGGGANHVLAYYNGTNWTVAGK